MPAQESRSAGAAVDGDLGLYGAFCRLVAMGIGCVVIVVLTTALLASFYFYVFNLFRPAAAAARDQHHEEQRNMVE